jgi:hypothetical protein
MRFAVGSFAGLLLSQTYGGTFEKSRKKARYEKSFSACSPILASGARQRDSLELIGDSEQPIWTRPPETASRLRGSSAVSFSNLRPRPTSGAGATFGWRRG